MNIKCKAPKRYALFCNSPACQSRLALWFTSNPGEGWPGNAHETGVMLFDPIKNVFSKHFEQMGCPWCKNHDIKYTEIKCQTVTIAELNLFLNLVDQTVKSSLETARLINRLRAYLEIGKINKMTFDQLYSDAIATHEALKNMARHIMGQEMPCGF